MKAKKSFSRIHYSSEKMDYGTPDSLFNPLNERFSFTLDPCATKANALCKKYFTRADNGLKQSWKGHRVFMNPPYGREQIDWVHKAIAEWGENGVFTVALLPARTDTKIFHEIMQLKDFVHIQFLKGRLTFKGAEAPAPFPSMLVYFL